MWTGNLKEKAEKEKYRGRETKEIWKDKHLERKKERKKERREIKK